MFGFTAYNGGFVSISPMKWQYFHYARVNANCKDKFEGSVSKDTIPRKDLVTRSVHWQCNKSLSFPVLVLSRLLLTLKSFGLYGCFITSHQNCISGPSTYDTDQGFSPVKPVSHNFTVVTVLLPKGAGDKLCLTPSYSSHVSQDTVMLLAHRKLACRHLRQAAALNPSRKITPVNYHAWEQQDRMYSVSLHKTQGTAGNQHKWTA